MLELYENFAFAITSERSEDGGLEEGEAEEAGSPEPFTVKHTETFHRTNLFELGEPAGLSMVTVRTTRSTGSESAANWRRLRLIKLTESTQSPYLRRF